MSTRCTIGYEDANGNTIGVYCHFDGYPKHMLPIIRKMDYDFLVEMVEDALVNDGLRGVTDEYNYETYKKESPRDYWLHTTPFAKLNDTDFCYIKRKNNTVFATSNGGTVICDE
jgi:hypothetical protein